MSPRHPLYEAATLFPQLRRDVVARLVADGVFAGTPPIPVLDSGDTDARTQADNALMARTGENGGGLCVAVGLSAIQPGGRGPNHVRVTLNVQVNENPVSNWDVRGRKLASEDLAAYVLTPLLFTDAATEGWNPSGIWTPLEYGGASVILATPSRVVWDVKFFTETRLRVATA